VRGKIIFVVILAMLVVLLYLVGSRTRDAHVMPKVRPEPVAEGGLPEATAGPGPGSTTPNDAVPGAHASTSAAPATPSADASAPLDRAMRVVAPSWELAAALYVGNGGATTADASAASVAHLHVEVTVSPDPRDVENRIARGGGESDGADVAVLPLPAFVAAYERLRALEPQIVHVVGWSHGREVLLGTKDGALTKPAPVAGDVTVASDDPATTALALFALDEAGTPPSRVRVAPDPKGATLAALVRPLPADRPADAPRRVLVTTADASRFVPFVAVAGRGFIDAHSDAMSALLRTWVDGASALRKDVPGAARRIATEPGALEPAAMLERLAWVSDPGPGDEAFALGVLGTDAVTVPVLFVRVWRLLRDAGALTSPAPGSVVATAPFSHAFAAIPARPALPPAGPDDAPARVLLARRIAKGDAEAVAAEMATLAGIFERSSVRITTRPASLAKDAADLASDHRGIRSGRLVVSPSPLVESGVALLEVLAAP
jgi:ABC-type nitrate/sulfonate/bicarbonate transport system substrate-binding protein